MDQTEINEHQQQNFGLSIEDLNPSDQSNISLGSSYQQRANILQRNSKDLLAFAKQIEKSPVESYQDSSRDVTFNYSASSMEEMINAKSSNRETKSSYNDLISVPEELHEMSFKYSEMEQSQINPNIFDNQQSLLQTLSEDLDEKSFKFSDLQNSQKQNIQQKQDLNLSQTPKETDSISLKLTEFQASRIHGNCPTCFCKTCLKSSKQTITALDQKSNQTKQQDSTNQKVASEMGNYLLNTQYFVNKYQIDQQLGFNQNNQDVSLGSTLQPLSELENVSHCNQPVQNFLKKHSYQSQSKDNQKPGWENLQYKKYIKQKEDLKIDQTDMTRYRDFAWKIQRKQVTGMSLTENASAIFKQRIYERKLNNI